MALVVLRKQCVPGVKMAKVRGRFIPLSLWRRMIGDWLKVSQRIPLAHGERQIDIEPLRLAVAAARPRPNWLPIFFKAYAIVAANRPILRRLYVRRPWARLYEHPENVGSVAIARRIDGEDALFYLPIVAPEKCSIIDIDAMLKAARERPLLDVPAFRRQLRWARLPMPLRQCFYHLAIDWMAKQRARQLGTFGMSVLASMGVANLSTWVPWTTMIHYTPFAKDGSMFLRIALDHRVLDGLEVAYALREMEEALNSTLLDEVRQLPKARAA
jgi:hypothetical protein